MKEKIEGVLSLKKHRISLLVMICITYSLCAGGPYGIEDMISSLGPGLAVVILLVFPFLWSVPQGLIAAELGSAMPDEGGYYVWVREAFGEFWAYQVGWWRTVSCYVDTAIYVVLAVAFLNALVPFNDLTNYIIKVGIIVFFTWINYRGLDDMGKFTTFLTLFVLFSVVVYVVLGVVNWNYNPLVPFAADGHVTIAGIGLGIALAVWIYSGYESMSTMAGEMENPNVIIKAIFISLPLVAATYTLPLIAGVASYGDWSNWGVDYGHTFVSTSYSFGIPGMVLFFSVAAILCSLSLYNSYLASGSRSFFVMAEDKLGPKFMARVGKKHGTPHNAIFVMAFTHLFLVQLDFTTLVVLSVFLFLSYYLVWFVAGIALRYKKPDMPRPFKIPGGNKFLIVLFIPPILICIISFFINGISYLVLGCLGILSGPLTYIIFKKIYGGLDESKKIAKKVWKHAIILSIITTIVLCGGLYAYNQQRTEAHAGYDDLYFGYIEENFEMQDTWFDWEWDSFVSSFTLRSNPDIEMEVWYYYGDMTGSVYIPGEHDEDEFIAIASGIVNYLFADGNLILSYVSFEDDAGNYTSWSYQ